MKQHRDGCTSERFVQWTGRLGDLMRTCVSCGYATPVVLGLDRDSDTDPSPAQTPDLSVPSSRYQLDCVRCGNRIQLHRPEPRIPLCERCRDRPRERTDT